MNKRDRKLQIKNIKKTTRENIAATLESDLKRITAEVGASGKSLEKKIKKAAKQVAKKLTKEVKFDKEALLKVASNPTA
ncbi:hypothetical protein MUY27_18945 [Mucilaginibacter sp. RS28]|uniref:Uncharacterized protein n=1 Tax=Mucilaginibacter straminoryzae TaxID=2932774 RepID=A0A9X1XBP6_9SPHI|nr:hypothetical protein [Mucilaginibacter straminoryzae]MCJ8211804.1 hypothetical protein [Mucilaginibacter straminoryzae]